MRFHPRLPIPIFPSSDEQRRNWVLVSPSAFELFMKGVEGKVQRGIYHPSHTNGLFVFQGGFSALNQKTNKLFFHILSEASFFFSLLNMRKPCCDGFFLWLPRYGRKVHKYSKKSKNELPNNFIITEGFTLFTQLLKCFPFSLFTRSDGMAYTSIMFKAATSFWRVKEHCTKPLRK